ncbi:phage holin family protein [Paenibacillus alba]|uniref:phage holin family protein n=1 Tax=Paenibacillus alba TaxID=1197127 RepID=UPI0015649FA7|nr:phage holin family protein [Paenibacillus alba]NQX67994.1 phage holin family protein [Paenibacillus alba]
MDVKLIASNVITAAAGATGKEITLASITAGVGTFIASQLGGWDGYISILVYLMMGDYLTGVLGAIKKKNLYSDVMFWGGIRKGIVLLVVFIAIQLDQLLGGTAPIFRTLAIFYYAGREGLSLIENSGNLGLPWPPAIKNALEQLKQKGEGSK